MVRHLLGAASPREGRDGPAASCVAVQMARTAEKEVSSPLAVRRPEAADAKVVCAYGRDFSPTVGQRCEA